MKEIKTSDFDTISQSNKMSETFNPDKRNEKAKKAQEITLNHHTNTVIAKKLKSLFDTIREEKK